MRQCPVTALSVMGAASWVVQQDWGNEYSLSFWKALMHRMQELYPQLYREMEEQMRRDRHIYTELEPRS